MNRYRLPCSSCGDTNLVTPTQAGQFIDCYHCNQEVAIPRLGAIKQLEPEFQETQIDSTNPKTGQPAKWSRKKGLVYAIGLFLLVIGVGLTATSLYQFKTARDEVIEAGKFLNLASKEERLAKSKELSLAQTHLAWGTLMTTGIQQWHGSRYYVASEKRDLFLNWSIATGGFSCIGLIMVVTAIVLKNE